MKSAARFPNQCPQQVAAFDWRDWLPPLVVILTIAAAATRARAQEDDEPDEQAQLPGQAQFDSRQFAHRIFGSELVESARARLDIELQIQVRRLDRQYALTDAQKDKLLLAGQGDIKRAFDRVDELKQRFELLQNDHNGAADCWAQARNIHSDLAGGLFGPGSLLSKSIATTITVDQIARAEKRIRESQSGLLDAAIIEAAAKLARLLDLSRDQSESFKKLMLNEIRRPRRWGEAHYAYVMYRLSKLPEDKLRPILRDPQWKLLQELLKSWNNAESFLEKDGFVLNESPAAGRQKVAGVLIQGGARTGE
jgi:hypothetical protein